MAYQTMESWSSQEWEDEVATLNSVWVLKKAQDEAPEGGRLNEQEQAVLDHVAWRVAKTAWGNPKRFTDKAAKATRFQKENVKKGRKKIRNAIKLLNRWLEPTKRENERDIKECPEHVAKVLQTEKTRNIAGFRKLAKVTGSTDTTLTNDIKFGFSDFRTLNKANTFPVRETPKKGANADKPTSSFAATIANLKKLKKPGFDDSLLEIVLNDIIADSKLGRYDKIDESEVHFQPALAFPVEQGDKVRTCIDERLRNSYLVEEEKIRLCGTSQVLEAISAFMADIGQEEIEKRFPIGQTPKEMHIAMSRTLDEWKGGEPGSMPDASRELIEAWIKHRNDTAKAKGTGVVPGLALEDFSKWYFQFAVDGCVESNIRAWNLADDKNEFFRSHVLNMKNSLVWLG